MNVVCLIWKRNENNKLSTGWFCTHNREEKACEEKRCSQITETTITNGFEVIRNGGRFAMAAVGYLAITNSTNIHTLFRCLHNIPYKPSKHEQVVFASWVCDVISNSTALVFTEAWQKIGGRTGELKPTQVVTIPSCIIYVQARNEERGQQRLWAYTH